MAKKEKIGSCTYCHRKEVVVTKDHVFSHSLFPDDVQHNINLPKVPSCKPCQKRFAKLEEYSKVSFAAVSAKSSQYREIFYRSGARSLEKNKRLQREFKAQTKDFLRPKSSALRSELGDVGRTHAPIQGKMKPIFEKFCRGMYFHETGKLMSKNAKAVYAIRLDEFEMADSANVKFVERSWVHLKRINFPPIEFEGERWIEYARAPFVNDNGQGVWGFIIHGGPPWLVYCDKPFDVRKDPAVLQKRKRRERRRRGKKSKRQNR